MGSACCIAAREKDLPSRTGGNALYRNVRCSPTWSFQWENRRRVASEIDDSPYQTSHRFSRDVSVEVKGPVGSDRGNLSDEVSLHESFGTPVSLKSPVHEGVVANLIAQPSGDVLHYYLNPILRLSNPYVFFFNVFYCPPLICPEL